MNLRAEAYLTFVASVITVVYLWSNNPWVMGAFTFVAQPLFACSILFYAIAVLKDMKAEERGEDSSQP
ncbi:MAG: hypothetical protein MK135_16650 [Polyangiaceae bacterium]|nr:hypothetical protein [Polyangiaceae bacterium]